ncbi:MAG: HlyD family efflux transporter periplasmic adaptor subunit [Kangiellaceae bacterium]|nr:HlyD family efflux transporter periplasmic adaptor subunit [Kangiellaceae bacterium]MCW8999126.1 HlyD family efflux transporter periplasmic adaptor subunit [Kangiellaceae bacterium]MCW9016366.1 HlyD family efflux transporter periplasmic adaptor subunit [Kangiellaceae bacterium]
MMDIQRVVKPKAWWRKYWYLFPIILIVGSAIFTRLFLGNTSYVVAKDKVQLAKVEQGQFRIEVRGVGLLKPQDTYWVSAQVAGSVEQVFIKPGNFVSRGQPLIKLSNPQISRDMEQASWELQATKAESKAALMVMESQLVELENSVDEAEFNYQSTKLKLDAEKELMNQGGGSISKIDFKRTQLSVTQQHQRWQAQQRRVQKMRDNIEASRKAQLARIEVVENRFQRATELVEQLTVTATHSGMVQQVSLELGQQASLGASVATIADHKSLIAELQIQELQIRDIELGQAVVIDTRSSEITGKVIRISPAVNEGMVQVDVELLSQLPSEARPDLNIEGRIVVNNISDTLYVKRPAFAPKNSRVSLFKLTDDRLFAIQSQVETGITSVSQIQIMSGLKAGDTIIISDVEKLRQHQQIMLN